MQILRPDSVVWCLIAFGAMHMHPTRSAADDVWRIIPQEARAISVVRNMSRFSEGIDHVARTMHVAEPHVLDAAMAQSGIRFGLDPTGSLAWVIQPYTSVKDETVDGTLYLLPVINYDRLIDPLISKPKDAEKKEPKKPGKAKKSKPIKPKSEAKPEPENVPQAVFEVPRPVRIAGHAAFVAELGNSAVFAFSKDRQALVESLDGGRGIQAELAPLQDWISEQDAYVIVTRAGIAEGIKDVELPLSRGSKFLDIVFAGVREAATTTIASDLDIQQLATAIAIDHRKGAKLSSRFVTGPMADLSLFFPQQPPGRDVALDGLPDLPFAMVIGGPVTIERNRQATQAVQELLQGLPQPDETDVEKELERKAQWRVLFDRVRIDVKNIQIGVYPLEPPKLKPGAAPKADPVQAIYDLLRSIVVVLKVDNARESLASVADYINAVPVPETAVPLDSKTQLIVRPLERGELEGTPVIRAIQPDEIADTPAQRVPCLMVAAPDQNTLIVITGSDAELERALRPFRPGGTRLVQSPRVQSSLQMLPASSSWVALVDGKASLDLAARTLVHFDSPSAWLLASMFPEAEPLAIGASWKQPMLDVTLAAPNDLLRAAGGLASWFPLFQ